MRSAIPKEDPIRKQAALLPDSLISDIFPARLSDESCLPSGVSTQNQAPFGTFVSISSASLSRPAVISAVEGLSGNLHSGSSIMRKLQKPFSLFSYSDAAVK